MTEALIIDACRTPRGIGKQGKGALADMHPQHLAATVLKALAERNNINTAEVDDIIWGTSTQKGAQGNDMGRMAALDAGYDTKASGMTLDRFCGSGITTVNLAAASIMSGMVGEGSAVRVGAGDGADEHATSTLLMQRATTAAAARLARRLTVPASPRVMRTARFARGVHRTSRSRRPSPHPAR